MGVFKLRDYSSDDRVTDTADLHLLQSIPPGVWQVGRALRLRELSGLQLCLLVSTGAHHSQERAGWSREPLYPSGDQQR